MKIKLLAAIVLGIFLFGCVPPPPSSQAQSNGPASAATGNETTAPISTPRPTATHTPAVPKYSCSLFIANFQDYLIPRYQYDVVNQQNFAERTDVRAYTWSIKLDTRSGNPWNYKLDEIRQFFTCFEEPHDAEAYFQELSLSADTQTFNDIEGNPVTNKHFWAGDKYTVIFYTRNIVVELRGLGDPGVQASEVERTTLEVAALAASRALALPLNTQATTGTGSTLVAPGTSSVRTVKICPNAASDRIYVVGLRSAPGINAAYVIESGVACGETVTVLNESQMADDVRWWRVSWNGYVGWMAEETRSGAIILPLEN